MSTNVSGPNKATANVTDEALDKDAIYYLLSNTRRRLAIETIIECGPLTKRELVELVGAKEYDIAPMEVTGQERKRVVISLGQEHIPTLEDHGIVEVVEQPGRHPDEIQAGPNIDELKPYLDVDTSVFQRVKEFFGI